MTGRRDPEQVVDLRQVSVLLRTYLRLSLRGGPAGFGRAARAGPLGGAAMAVGMNVLFGAIVSLAAWHGLDVFTFGLTVHGVTFLLVLSAAGLVTGDVLLSRDETDVLGFRPVSSATLLLAKGTNLAVYSLVLALSLNSVPMFAGLALRGARPWFPLVHGLGAMLLALFCAGTLVLLHATLVRVVPRAWFEHAATWTQVALSLGAITTLQILPRYTESHPGLSLVPALGWLTPLPPTWFAALDAGLAGPRFDPPLVTLGLAGCVLSAGVFAAALGRLSPGYGAALARIAEVPGPRSRERARRARGAADPLAKVSPLLRPWLRDPVERAAWRLVTIYMRRDRELMMRLYPALGSWLVLLLIPLFSGSGGEHALPFTAAIMLGLLSTVVVEILELSTHHGAAELFRRAPLADSAALFHGARKAVMLWVLLPSLVVLVALAFLVSPVPWFTVAAFLPVLPVLPPLTLLPALNGPCVPLSIPPLRGANSAGRILIMLPAAAIATGAVALGGLAGAAGLFVPFLAIEVVVAAGLHALLLARVRTSARIGAAAD